MFCFNFFELLYSTALCLVAPRVFLIALCTQGPGHQRSHHGHAGLLHVRCRRLAVAVHDGDRVGRVGEAPQGRRVEAGAAVFELA